MELAMMNRHDPETLNTASVVVQPVQWSRFHDIDDVEPLNASDYECLAEVRDVLKRYNSIDRFGVALLHSHFALAEDEVMLETSDDASRTLMLRPVKSSQTGQKDVGTIWALKDGDFEAMTWCRSYCQRLLLGHGDGHNRE